MQMNPWIYTLPHGEGLNEFDVDTLDYSYPQDFIMENNHPGRLEDGKVSHYLYNIVTKGACKPWCACMCKHTRCIKYRLHYALCNAMCDVAIASWLWTTFYTRTSTIFHCV